MDPDPAPEHCRRPIYYGSTGSYLLDRYRTDNQKFLYVTEISFMSTNVLTYLLHVSFEQNICNVI
jgi:hypothetical protein